MQFLGDRDSWWQRKSRQSLKLFDASETGEGPDAEPELPPAGYEDVNSTIVCVLTRFGLRRPWHLVQTYIAYRWLMRRVQRTAPSGLLKATFLVEDLTTCYSLSLWADDAAIPFFGTSVEEHVVVARGVFGRLRFSTDRPEIWSTKWRLFQVSNNLNWAGFDLRQIIAEGERM